MLVPAVFDAGPLNGEVSFVWLPPNGRFDGPVRVEEGVEYHFSYVNHGYYHFEGWVPCWFRVDYNSVSTSFSFGKRLIDAGVMPGEWRHPERRQIDYSVYRRSHEEDGYQVYLFVGRARPEPRPEPRYLSPSEMWEGGDGND